MKKIIIREEIAITQKEIDEVIEEYKKVPKTYTMCALGSCYNRDQIIKEIKKLSEFGKHILVMSYEFKKWEKKQKK